jgi:hypothetical protein
MTHGFDQVWPKINKFKKQNKFQKQKLIPMHALHSSVDAEKFLVSATLLSVVFKSLCDLLSVCFPA